MIRAIVGCECSGAIRRALRALGYDAWSVDIKPAEDGSPYHIQDDVLAHLDDGWDLGIFHPTCTYLTNSGVRWLHEDRKSMTADQRWEEMVKGAVFYRALRDAPIPHVSVENPIMHCYASALVQPGFRQVVQPWWFGDPFFKATGFELRNLPALKPTNKLIPPKKGDEQHKEWSAVHREPPGPNRQTNRSRTFPGLALAAADQWGSYVMEQRAQRLAA